MELFKPKKIDLSSINKGERYINGDGVDAEAINAPIEASAWVQSLATNPPDVSQASNVGNVMVSIKSLDDGTPCFVFSNLKGATGDKGDKGDKGDTGYVEVARLI